MCLLFSFLSDPQPNVYHTLNLILHAAQLCDMEETQDYTFFFSNDSTFCHLQGRKAATFEAVIIVQVILGHLGRQYSALDLNLLFLL